MWPLLWLAPVPVLAIAPRLQPQRCLCSGAAVVVSGRAEFVEIPRLRPRVALAANRYLVCNFGVIFALAVLLVRTFLWRGWLFLAALALPLFWVTCEYVSASVSPHSTYGNLAYTQMENLPLIQIASLIGIWGISFFVFLFAGTVATLLSGSGGPRERRALAITVGAVLCTVLLFGTWRLRSNTAAKSAAVVLIAKDMPMSAYLGSEQQALELLREYADEIRRVTPPGIDVVVLPEKIARVSENALPEVDALFGSAAAATGATIDIGLVRRTSSGAFNSSRVHSPDQKVSANYDKHHLC